MPNEKPIPQQIPIEKIHDLPGVTDFKLPEKSYGTLVSSILVNGLREPVILRPLENGEYQLVHGYRRRKAAELAKLKKLDALVYDMTEKEAKDYRLAVAANPEAPIPGKLVEKPAESKAAPHEEEKPTEKKAEAAPAKKKADDKQPTKAAEPQEKKAEPAEKKAEAAAPSAAKPENKKPAEPPKPDQETKADDQKEKKAAEAAAPAATEKVKKAAPAKAPAKEEEKPVGNVAEGPTGTAITKLLGEKLSPPSEKDKKSLPIPGEGEAFSAILHPAYLKKADINTFSVDRDSDDFKELFQSIKRFGVKDPVLARFNKAGELTLISSAAGGIVSCAAAPSGVVSQPQAIMVYPTGSLTMGPESERSATGTPKLLVDNSASNSAINVWGTLVVNNAKVTAATNCVAIVKANSLGANTVSYWGETEASITVHNGIFDNSGNNFIIGVWEGAAEFWIHGGTFGVDATYSYTFRSRCPSVEHMDGGSLKGTYLTAGTAEITGGSIGGPVEAQSYGSNYGNVTVSNISAAYLYCMEGCKITADNVTLTATSTPRLYTVDNQRWYHVVFNRGEMSLTDVTINGTAYVTNDGGKMKMTRCTSTYCLGLCPGSDTVLTDCVINVPTAGCVNIGGSATLTIDSTKTMTSSNTVTNAGGGTVFLSKSTDNIFYIRSDGPTITVKNGRYYNGVALYGGRGSPSAVVLNGGVFDVPVPGTADVLDLGSGTFNGAVTAAATTVIHGGTFNSTVTLDAATNEHYISGGQFTSSNRTAVTAARLNEDYELNGSYAVVLKSGRPAATASNGSSVGSPAKILNATASGQTVSLLADGIVAADQIATLCPGATLDLAGHVLTVSGGFYAVGDIVDSVGGGKLIFQNSTYYLRNDTTGVMGLRNKSDEFTLDAAGVYQFYEYAPETISPVPVLEAGEPTGNVTFWYRLDFENKDAYQLLSRGWANAGLTLTIRVDCERFFAGSSTYTYKSESKLVEYARNSYEKTTPQGLNLTLSELGRLRGATVYVTPILQVDGGTPIEMATQSYTYTVS